MKGEKARAATANRRKAKPKGSKLAPTSFTTTCGGEARRGGGGSRAGAAQVRAQGPQECGAEGLAGLRSGSTRRRYLFHPRLTAG